MKRNARTAFNQLKKLGCPVNTKWSKTAHFSISAELNFDPAYGDTLWADSDVMTDGGGMSYLDDSGVNKKISEILSKYGLYAEWYNPGVLSVYDA